MDVQPVSTCQKIQATSLTSIHVQEPHRLAIADTVVLNPQLPEMAKNKSCCYYLLSPFYWLLKKIIYLLAILFFVILFFVLSVGTLSFVTFLFLLASLLVLRFSQFIKWGEEYDKATQVKAIVEWFLVVNGVILAFAIWLSCEVGSKFFSLELDVTIVGKSLFDWGKIISMNALAIVAIRLILFWIIQKNMPRMTLEHNESGLKVIQTTCDIVDCFFFQYIGSALIDYFPGHKIFGYLTRNWIDVTIFVIIGWNVIALSTHLVVWSIHKLLSRYLDSVHCDTERSHRLLLLERLLSVQCLVYYGNGMKRSFNFMLSSLLLLLVWVFGIGSQLVKTDYMAKTMWAFGTRTFATLLILSFLWLLKDFVLLSWEANAVYNRLSSKILEARKSLYFLGMLGRHSHDILKLRYEVVDERYESTGEENTKSRAQVFLAKNMARVNTFYQDVRDLDDKDEMDNSGRKSGHLKPKLSSKKRVKVKQDLLLRKNDTMTFFHIQQVAQYFLAAANGLLEETFTSDILRKVNAPSVAGNDSTEISPMTRMSNVSDVVLNLSNTLLEDWNHFKEFLDFNASNDDCHIKMKTWVEKSHNKCLFLANTLRSAKEIVDCLDNFISVALICASFVVWLMFTGLADIKVLFLIASPLLAASFVFGDTCKSLFQGIIFVYVVHPIDVGDLCVIDEKMLEVKSIGVWTTIFSNIDKVGTQEVVVYPNSELAIKTFINHKTEFDWNESVEFDVEHLDEQQIKELKKQIEDLLDAEIDDPMTGKHSVSVTSTGKDMKIAVRFRHNKHNVDMTYFECLKEKDDLRSAFILQVQKLANKEKSSLVR